MSATLVVGALGTHAIQAAPGHVISAVAASAGTAGAGAGNVAALAKLALEAMNAARRRLMMFKVGVGALLLLLALLGLRWLAPSGARTPVPQFATQPANQNVSGQRAAPANAVAGAAIVRPTVGELLLRVVDSATSASIPNARITVRERIGTLNWTTNRIETDSNGECRLPVDRAAEEEWDLYVEILKEGYALQFANWSWARGDAIEDIPAEFTARLVSAPAIGGILVNEQGEPVSDAQVLFGISSTAHAPMEPREREGLLRESIYHAETTDFDGHWHCGHVPPQLDGLLFYVIHSNYVETVFGVTKLGAPPSRDITYLAAEDFRGGSARMVMRRGFVVDGSVADEQGRPIAGAQAVENHDWDNSQAAQWTDADGHFRLANLPPGESTITVQANGYVASDSTVPPGGGDKELRFELTRAARLLGRVVDEAGAPVHGLVLAASGDYRSNRFNWSVETDGEGKFGWQSAPWTQMLYQIQAPGYEIVLHTNLVADGSEQLIAMHRSSRPPPVRISGTVTDEQTGHPINDFQVCMGLTWEDPLGSKYFVTSLPVLETTGQDGKFGFPLGGPTPSHSIQTYTIQIKANGYATTELKVPGPLTNNCRLDLKVKRPDSVAGEVLTPDGEPAEGAEVACCLKDARLQMDDSGKFDLVHTSAGIPHTTTEAQGHFAMALAPGAQQIIFTHRSGYAVIPSSDLSAASVVTLEPWGRIEGLLKIGNQAGTNETVFLGNGMLSPSRAGFWLHLSTATDAEGRFVMEHVPPGKWEIGRQLDDHAGGTSWTQLQQVELPAGRTVQVALGGTGWKVAGTVRSSVVEESTNRLRRFPNITLKTASSEPSKRLYAPMFGTNGAFTFDDVLPGNYELSGVAISDPPRPRVLGGFHMDVTLPELPDGSDLPIFDVGILELQPITAKASPTAVAH